jgi:hypothetical protein
MDVYLQALFYGDFLSLLVLSGALYVVGSSLVGRDATCVRSLQRVWYATFIGFGIAGYFEYAPQDAATILRIVIRGLLVAAIVSGAIGIFLRPLMWLWSIIVTAPLNQFKAWRVRRKRERHNKSLEKERLRLRQASDAEWERRRPERERAALEKKLDCEREAARRHKQDIDDALLVLQEKRRALVALYVQNKPLLDAAKWDENSILDFADYEKRVRLGQIPDVFDELRCLSEAMQGDAAIGDVKRLYESVRPIIESDISTRMFSTLVDGIPRGSLKATQTACEKIRELLVASRNRWAPHYQALEEEKQLDALDASLTIPFPSTEEELTPKTDVWLHRVAD